MVGGSRVALPSAVDGEAGCRNGEGYRFSISEKADEDGDFSIDLPCDLDAGDLTATATDMLKNTSEFSENLITLGTSSCEPDPTDTPVPTDTPMPPKVCGDVNEDRVTNSVGATLILPLKPGLNSSLANESSRDVTNSGLPLTSVDAAIILHFTAGLIGEDELDCG